MRLYVLYSLLGIMQLVPLAHAAGTPEHVRLGTAAPGGGFQLFGQHLAEVITASDRSLHVEAIATRGSTQNLADLEAGKIDIGLWKATPHVLRWRASTVNRPG